MPDILWDGERPSFPLNKGDSVIYDPLYPTEGFWNRQKGKEMIVHDWNEMFMWVCSMDYAGLDTHEVPYSKLWKLNRSAFKPFVTKVPSWEL
jgi:hypothetical protein